MPYSSPPAPYAPRESEPERPVPGTSDAQGSDAQRPDGADSAGGQWEGYSADILDAVLDG
jgi:hypothetical protein